MRYQQIEAVDFTNVLGETRKVHKQRAEIIGKVVSEFDKPSEQDLDDIGVNVYGNGSEFFTYKLRDQNVVKLLNYNFDESLLPKVQLGDTI